MNLFLEKDKEGNYKNKKFVEQNKDFIVTVCKAYKNEDVIKVLNLFFEKDEEIKNFISQFTQDFNFHTEANQNITVLVEQQLPVEELNEFLNILITKENGNYVYENFLKQIRSYFFELFFTRYSVVSKDMFNLILEYIKFAYSTNIDVDFNYNLTKSLFDSLNENIDVLPEERKEEIIFKLINILAKYSKTNNITDTKVKEIRSFLLNNINPAEQTDKQKTNLIAEIFLDSLENALPLIKKGLVDKNDYNEISELLNFVFTNYGSKNKNFITEPIHRERFVKILASYYFELEKIFESYDDKEISKFDHNKNSFLGLTVKNSQLTFMTEAQKNEEQQEKTEKILLENMLLLFNKINLFNIKEQNIIFNNNTDKAKTMFNVISGINDFQLLNDKVKKCLSTVI